MSQNQKQQDEFSSQQQQQQQQQQHHSFKKQQSKKRTKGQRLDTQLLGFTVQPDSNLKNRGDIEDDF